MPVSPTIFRHAFNRFQSIHEQESGKPLDNFSERDSLAYEWEDYKKGIPHRALAVLEPQKWTKAMIGSGAIVSKVIQAIELPGNNLLQWEGRNGPASRAHLRVIEAQDDPEARRELETLFFDLYHRGKADKTTFEAIVAQCGKRYELLGYLFFIAAPERFLPLRTRSFDKAFAELGVNLRTEGNCGWENYLAFLAAIRDVQRCLHAEGLADASLLDAHSFCWILARHEAKEEVPAPRPSPIMPFSGTLKPALPGGQFTSRDDAETRDMQEEAQKRQASGLIAEEVALNTERERLRHEGRDDLAAKVESVSLRPGLGYDIHSFEKDGTERFIEVKNVSNGPRFFLSEGEWQNSRARANYWFYLVSGTDAALPKVVCLSAKELQQEHLQPVQYLVRYSTH
jgi:hypothetical protein